MSYLKKVQQSLNTRKTIPIRFFRLRSGASIGIFWDCERDVWGAVFYDKNKTPVKVEVRGQKDQSYRQVFRKLKFEVKLAYDKKFRDTYNKLRPLTPQEKALKEMADNWKKSFGGLAGKMFGNTIIDEMDELENSQLLPMLNESYKKLLVDDKLISIPDPILKEMEAAEVDWARIRKEYGKK